MVLLAAGWLAVYLAPDISLLDLGRHFDFVWAFSVLFHMSDEILQQTLGFVARHLSSDGVFLANIHVGDRPPGAWQGFPVVWRTLEHYESACAANGLGVADLGPLEALGHHSGIAEQDSQRMLRIVRAA